VHAKGVPVPVSTTAVKSKQMTKLNNSAETRAKAKTSFELSVAGFLAKFQTFCQIFAETLANFHFAALPMLKPELKID
jgi:hypothetical protein